MITERLELETLMPSHAEALFPGLGDRRLYTFIDDEAPVSIAALRARYERLAAQRSPDGLEVWLNWAVRKLCNQEYIGFVQATLTKDGCATIAFVLFYNSWGKGYGKEAVAAMLTELRTIRSVSKFRAFINPRNRRSETLLRSLGFKKLKAKKSMPSSAGCKPSEAEYVLSRISPIRLTGEY